MQTFVVFLRGINVGGQRPVKMAELREALEQGGFLNVRTYIQSGNIALQSTEGSPAQVSQKVQQCILNRFGFEVPACTLSRQALSVLHKKLPFAEAAAQAPTKVLASLWQAPPPPEHLQRLQSLDCGREEFEAGAHGVYLHCPDGYGRAKLNNNYLEKILDAPLTTRNWKTIRKMLDVASL
ncbi:DUF1697 domain-containing protein [Phaeodactylibacter luteus]|uniref:DUF1697 domain-containing protein n=1 Tax=Phaeodactylibacter luteus TaxID=1564516 RepID=A0A5C6S796_9BACT|nr:DUF1697 domain-containing protein [Phaeodactylibacter luteus]TXB70223.1 DUF1697 domain-containing protein [Phaeodactylibacter luteus]